MKTKTANVRGRLPFSMGEGPGGDSQFIHTVREILED
jgi:hypothetical protein